MLKRLLSIVLSTIIITSAFTILPIDVNAVEAAEPTDSIDAYSPTEVESATVAAEPETVPPTEQPSETIPTTETPTESSDNDSDTVEMSSKPEIASTGENNETYEQAARYVPNYVITDGNTIQPIYNPYTVQMLLDLSDDAYQVKPDYSDGWQRTLNYLGYTTRIATTGQESYAVGEISNGDGIPATPIMLGTFNAIIGVKRVVYNGQEKYAFVVAFRGTKSIQDFVDVDAEIFPTLEGFHSGFRNSAGDFLNYFKNSQFTFDGETVSGNGILTAMKAENSKIYYACNRT